MIALTNAVDRLAFLEVRLTHLQSERAGATADLAGGNMQWSEKR